MPSVIGAALGDAVGGLGHRAGRRPVGCAGGHRARVAAAAVRPRWGPDRPRHPAGVPLGRQPWGAWSPPVGGPRRPTPHWGYWPWPRPRSSAASRALPRTAGRRCARSPPGCCWLTPPAPTRPCGDRAGCCACHRAARICLRASPGSRRCLASGLRDADHLGGSPPGQPRRPRAVAGLSACPATQPAMPARSPRFLILAEGCRGRPHPTCRPTGGTPRGGRAVPQG